MGQNNYSGDWGINCPPPQKHHPLFLPKSPLNQQTVQAPLIRQSSPIYWFFKIPPLKVGFFSEPQKY